MTTTQKTVTSLVTLLIVFLLGFAPQYLEKRQVQTELAISVQKLNMSEIRDLAGLMLLETLHQNYGTARDYASRYFDKLRETSDQTEDAALKASLQELLSSRDAVTTALSNGDPASSSQLQTLLARTHAITKAQP